MTGVVNGIGPQLQSIKDVYQPAAIVKALAPAYEIREAIEGMVDVKEDRDEALRPVITE